jgi:hypothetical protein
MSSVVTSSPDPRRIATPSWFDLRLVLGVVLVLASVLIGASVVSRASDTDGVVVATHDLSAGTILRGADVRVVQVQLPHEGRAAYLADPDDAVGRTLDRAVERGSLLPGAAVTEAPPRTTLTVPFTAGTAPALHAGQRIEIWLSTPRCAFVVLLPEVTVQSVRAGDSGSFSDAGSGQNVVISVEPQLAPRVVSAQSIEDARLSAGVLVGGRASGAPSIGAPAGSSAAPAMGGLPADLAACAGS